MAKKNPVVIKPYEKNPKKHPDNQLKQIANSLREFGWQQPIVVDKKGVIIVGHGRWFAYKKYPEGIKEPWIKRAEDLTEEQVRAYRLADNKLNESEWDMGLAIEELKGLSDEMFDLTGFDKDLLIGVNEEDDIIPENAPQRTKRGDQWILGKHRVVCGDSTKKEDIEKLMGEKYAKLIFTSPPYNMGAGMYENYEDNLKSQEYIDFNIKVIEGFKKYLKGFVFWNLSYNKKSRTEFIEIIYRIIKETGLKFLELIVWNKKHAMPITSKEMMTRQYEDILLVGDDDIIKEELEMFFCGRNDKSAYFNKKTQKGIITMTNKNDIVVDPFLGSGSTLIACEKTNRICYGMEISPEYVDIIIQRYENYTNKKAKKISR